MNYTSRFGLEYNPFIKNSKEILVGQPVLNSTLNLKNNEAIRQRIITSYKVERMSMEESIKYVRGKLNGAGCMTEVFSEQALRAISSYSAGNPRIISRVCDMAMMIANNKGKTSIDEDVAMAAINEVEL